MRALSTTRLVEVILGKFKQKNVKCGVTTCNSLGQKWFQMPEEKRTDVNIAVFMLEDAYQNACDQMIIFSGDSDLVPAINMVRKRFPAKKIIVYVPSRDPVRGAPVELRTAAHVNRTLPRGHERGFEHPRANATFSCFHRSVTQLRYNPVPL